MSISLQALHSPFGPTRRGSRCKWEAFEVFPWTQVSGWCLRQCFPGLIPQHRQSGGNSAVLLGQRGEAPTMGVTGSQGGGGICWPRSCPDSGSGSLSTGCPVVESEETAGSVVGSCRQVGEGSDWSRDFPSIVSVSVRSGPGSPTARPLFSLLCFHVTPPEGTLIIKSVSRIAKRG